MKSAIYGTLTGLLNAKNAETGGTIVKMASDLLQESLAKYQWRNAKLLLRFFGELVNSNVILPTTLLQVMEQLLVVLEEPTVLRVRKAFYDILKYFLTLKRIIDHIAVIFVCNTLGSCRYRCFLCPRYSAMVRRWHSRPQPPRLWKDFGKDRRLHGSQRGGGWRRGIRNHQGLQRFSMPLRPGRGMLTVVFRAVLTCNEGSYNGC